METAAQAQALPRNEPDTSAPEALVLDGEAILSIVREEMYAQTQVWNDRQRKCDQIQHFMCYVLFVDYGPPDPALIIAPEVYDACLDIYNRLHALQKLSSPPTIDEWEVVEVEGRDERTSWLSETLYQPCLTLGFPVEYVIETLIRFYYSKSLRPQQYAGCIQDIARYGGMDKLAQKLWFDKAFIIPSIGPAAKWRTLRTGMQRQVDSVGALYFKSLTGCYLRCVYGNQCSGSCVDYELREPASTPRRMGWPASIEGWIRGLWRGTEGDGRIKIEDEGQQASSKMEVDTR